MDLDEKKSRKKMYSKPNKNSKLQVPSSKTGFLSSKLGLKSTSSSSMNQDEPLEDIYHHNPDERILIFRRHSNYSYFGEEDIMRMRNRSCNAVCTKDCELYTLDKIVHWKSNNRNWKTSSNKSTLLSSTRSVTVCWRKRAETQKTRRTCSKSTATSLSWRWTD